MSGLLYFGSTPSYGNGLWTTISGSGTALFEDSTSYNTVVSVSESRNNIYEFEWKETNWLCVDSTILQIGFYYIPEISAGNDTILDFIHETTISGTEPIDIETSQWEIVSGTGYFTEQILIKQVEAVIRKKRTNQMKLRLSLSKIREIEQQLGVFLESQHNPKQESHEPYSVYDEQGDYMGTVFAHKGFFKEDELVKKVKQLLNEEER